MLKRLILITAAALTAIMQAGAQNPEIPALARPVNSVYSLEIGGRRQLCSYLSPLYYSGPRFAVSGFWTKAMPFSPEHAVMTFDASAELSRTLNPAHTATALDARATFSYGLAWRLRFTADWQLTVGGRVNIGGGVIYLARNSNNPAQALANVDLGLQASISRRFKIGRLPVLAADRVTLPMAGLFFMPQYGETYYEIYLGNHSGLAHFGWPGNHLLIDNHLSVTLDLGRTALQLGYRFSFTNQEACHLINRSSVNSFTIGVIPGGIGLKKPRPACEALY